MGKTYDKGYFEYLKNRSSIEKSARKLLYRGLIREINGRVLDVGCGLGEFMQGIPGSIGIEVNPFCVRYCNQIGLNVKRGSATKIRFSSGHFDTVLCIHMLEHLEHPEKAVKEMYRVLKPGGKLIVVVPTECGYRNDKTHKTFLYKENLRELLEDSGFKIKSIYYYPFSSKFMREKLPMNVLRAVAIRKHS